MKNYNIFYSSHFPNKVSDKGFTQSKQKTLMSTRVGDNITELNKSDNLCHVAVTNHIQFNPNQTLHSQKITGRMLKYSHSHQS